MKYFFKIILFIFTLNFANLTQVLANDVYFIDYAKVMNESKAGKKAQDNKQKVEKEKSKGLMSKEGDDE